MEAALIILAIMSPALLAILSHFVLSLRKGAGGGKEIAKLRGELESMRHDYAQLKADHTDMLLSLERATHRLEARVDKLAGIEAPMPDPARREPPQRQL